jgi:hypothetical protein
MSEKIQNVNSESIDTQQATLKQAEQVLKMSPIPRFFKALFLPKATKATYKDLKTAKAQKHETIKSTFDPNNIFEVENFDF